MPFAVILFTFLVAWTVQLKPSIVKRHARQLITNKAIGCPIRSPETFYEETKKHFKNMEVFYVSKERIQEISEEKNLKGRFEKTRTIPGIT